MPKNQTTAAKKARAAQKTHGGKHTELLAQHQPASLKEAEEADLPHDEYMAAVADALAVCGIPPQWWTSEDDSGANTDRLDAVFLWRGVASSEHWPHGVYLTWDQYDGWRLIEEGGGRNIYDLSPDSLVYCDPRQVAADVQARLTHGLDGWAPGPICISGARWDTEATYKAVTAWCAEQASDDSIG